MGNRRKRTRTKLKIILEGFWRRFIEFGGISTSYQNPPYLKPWAIAQAFCSKTANFRHFEFSVNRQKRSCTKIEIILEGILRRFREFGAISTSYQNPPCLKPWAIAQAFCSKTANFRHFEFSVNRQKRSRTKIEMILEGFLRRFREFGAISTTYQNPPCSKPWAIAQAFWSKMVNFRHL